MEMSILIKSLSLNAEIKRIWKCVQAISSSFCDFESGLICNWVVIFKKYIRINKIKLERHFQAEKYLCFFLTIWKILSYRGKGEFANVYQITSPASNWLSSWQSLVSGEKSCNMQNIRHRQEIA